MGFRREHLPALEDDSVPEGPAVRMVAFNEENAYWDRGMGVAAPGPGLPSRIVATSGTPDQRERFLGPFRGTDQPRWGSFALTEPGGGSDTAAFRTRATRTDRGYLLNGAKCFIGNAARAVGMARSAYDEALGFAKASGAIRTARVRDRLEAMHRQLRAAWLMTLRAAWKADRKIPNIVDASMAKVFAAETAQDLASAGMEIVGLEAGAGHHLVEKLFRDAKALNIVEGTGQIQRIIMGRSLVGLPR